jgi:hypothetical protein
MMFSVDSDRSACNFLCANLASISEPNDPFRPTFNNIKRLLINTIFYRFPFLIPLFNSVILKRSKGSITPSAKRLTDVSNQNIAFGDTVEILSELNIRKSLDNKNKLKGLGFMPEMGKYCGRQFRVLKIVSRIKIESTGELRILKNPVIILEGVYCDGEFHDSCERLCFLFWRKEWLTKV